MMSEATGGSIFYKPAHASGLETDSLHYVYRVCMTPLKICESTERLLRAGASVNQRDEKGWTPLAGLILHVNRGLRWHAYKVPELEALELMYGNKTAMEELCVKVDERYQEQVKRCLMHLLEKGADVNAPLRMVPAVAHSNEWIETFEHKLIQSEFRWNLLFASSMEFSTYSAFNPLTKYCVPNSCDMTLVHLAAWRGDAYCLEALLKHGASAKAGTVGGRTALHFLYLYCNKPSDLPTCTQMLVTHGVDVHSVDTKGRSALHLLLSHVITKRSHVMYLANSYNNHGVYSPSYDPKKDNFHTEIKECVDILLQAGASIDLKGKSGLAALYESFEHALEGCDEAFQPKGHYLVPYQFLLWPVLEFSQHLTQLGSLVNRTDVRGHTSLHKLVLCLRTLSLSDSLNPASQLLACFNALMKAGVNVNAQDHLGRTACDYLVEQISSRPVASLPRYLPVLQLFYRHHVDLSLIDRHGSTLLHRLLSNAHIRQRHLHGLLVSLLQAGANPNLPDQEAKYPLNKLLALHVFHHDPLHEGNITQNLTPYLVTMATLAAAMTTDALNAVIGGYRRSGFCGLVCASQCPVYVLLSRFFEEPRSLKHCCKVVIWKSLPHGFFLGAEELPLPTEIKKYLLDYEISQSVTVPEKLTPSQDELTL